MVIGEHAPEAFDAARAVREGPAARERICIGGCDVGDRDRQAVLVKVFLHGSGVIAFSLLLPLMKIDGGRLHAPARSDAALPAIVGDGPRVLAGRRDVVLGIRNGQRVVRDGLIGVVHVMFGPIARTIEPAVDRQFATLVYRESALVQMHVGPVVVSGAETHVGGARRPVAARDHRSDAIEMPR